jgi:hypothetical protein
MSHYFETYTTGAPDAPSIPAPVWDDKSKSLWVSGRTNIGPGQSCVFRTEVQDVPKMDPKLVVVVAEALATKLVQPLPGKNEGRTQAHVEDMSLETRTFGMMYPTTDEEKLRAKIAKQRHELAKAEAALAALNVA